MVRRPPRTTLTSSSAASGVYKKQDDDGGDDDDGDDDDDDDDDDDGNVVSYTLPRAPETVLAFVSRFPLDKKNTQSSNFNFPLSFASPFRI